SRSRSFCSRRCRAPLELLLRLSWASFCWVGLSVDLELTIYQASGRRVWRSQRVANIYHVTARPRRRPPRGDRAPRTRRSPRRARASLRITAGDRGALSFFTAAGRAGGLG